MKILSKNEYCCPCSGNCCDNPIVTGTDHECECEDFCEECYCSECQNCGATCCCDL